MDRLLEKSKALVLIAIVSSLAASVAASLIAFSHFGGKD